MEWLKQFFGEKIYLYLLYFWKKLRDSKIRTKITVYLVLVAIICSLVIGSISYFTMKDSLIDTAKDSAISLLKQVGTRLEDRAREFQDTSYSFSTQQEILNLMLDGDNTEINQFQYSLNQSLLSGTFLMFNNLHKYSDFVISESQNKNVYFYDQSEKKDKITLTEAKELLELLGEEVTETTPVKWLKKGEQTYFVRRVVSQSAGTGTKFMGTVIFAISQDFFDLEEEPNPYVSDQNIIVAGENGDIYKNNRIQMDEKDLQYYLSYKEGKYYVYSTLQTIEDEKYLVVPLRTIRFQWNVLCFIPQSIILEKANNVIPKILVTTGLLLGMGLILGIFLYKSLKKNLEIIEQGMRQYETGNYSKLLSPASYDELGLLILQFNHMGHRIHELNVLTMKEEEEKQELQYQVMEAQINPHFLYNTLGSLKWLAYEKEQLEIAKLADAIIGLLRFTVKNANQWISLGDELEYVRQYIYIQQMRYEDAFCLEEEVTEEARNFKIIGFLLQPFLENSILHGLDTAKKDGLIQVIGKVRNKCLYLSVRDNGMGMSMEKLQELKKKMGENKTEKYKGFNGIGVVNIILRLKMVYGEGFEYQIESGDGEGTTITLMIPERKNGNEKESIDCRR